MVEKDEVKRVAHLALLEIEPEHIDKFSRQFNEILEYMEEINELDLSQCEAAFHITELKNVFREDELKPSFDRDVILKNAPEPEDGAFKVPKVIER